MSGAQTRWARTLLRGLAAGGVRHVVISPGSRSTPLVLAAEHAGLVCHDVVDERSAAFFALGIGRATGLPAALVCTSGSAPGHYLPAVMEASAAHVPLLVVSADRPPELQGGGANQTTDQQKLFGAHVRRFFDLGTTPGDALGLRATARLGAQAAHLTTAPLPGPVHVNVRFRKPFETESTEPSPEPPRFFAARSTASPDGLSTVVGLVRDASRALVVLGPSAPRAAHDRAALAALAAAGCGVLVDAASGYRFAGVEGALVGFEAALRSEVGRDRLRADVIVQLGEPPTGSAWLTFLEGHGGFHVVVDPYGVPDASSTATHVLAAEPDEVLRALAAELAPRRAWVEPVATALREARVRALGGGFGHAVAVAEALGAMPDGSTLFLGNSLSVRLVDLFAEHRALRVLHQRGLSGIDGAISGAAGVASASDGPTLALMGDVTFAHDLGGLATARGLRTPLVVLVLDDGGGRIFEQLPVSKSAGRALFEAHFAMPPQLDMRAAAATYGHRFACAASAVELASALREALANPGCTVVRVPLAESGAREDISRLDAALAEALS